MSHIPSHEVFKSNGNASVSSTTTYYSKKTDIQRCKGLSYQLYNTGTMTGTWTVQVSNKPAPNEANDDDWTALTLAVPISQPSNGSPASEFVGLEGIEARWSRMKYVNASGTGAPEAYVNGKDE